jgi:hypothetical protein
MPSLTRRRLLAGVGVLAAAAGAAVVGALTASSGDGDSAKRSAPPPGPLGPLLSALEREARCWPPSSLGWKRGAGRRDRALGGRPR